MNGATPEVKAAVGQLFQGEVDEHQRREHIRTQALADSWMVPCPAIQRNVTTNNYFPGTQPDPAPQPAPAPAPSAPPVAGPAIPIAPAVKAGLSPLLKGALATLGAVGLAGGGLGAGAILSSLFNQPSTVVKQPATPQTLPGYVGQLIDANGNPITITNPVTGQ